MPLRLDVAGRPLLVIGAWFGLAIVTTLAALLPAKRAARLPVVDALTTRVRRCPRGYMIMKALMTMLDYSARLLFIGAATRTRRPLRRSSPQPTSVRNPHQPFRSTIRFTEYIAGHERDHDAMIVYAKEDPATGQFRNLVQYSEPARDAGKRVLLDGGALWFYDPASKTSVRISPQQRLIGQAAVGDVLTVNLKVDYNASLVSTETIPDAERAQRQCWHLSSRRQTRAIYNRIEYWVEQNTFYPSRGSSTRTAAGC